MFYLYKAIITLMIYRLNPLGTILLTLCQYFVQLFIDISIFDSLFKENIKYKYLHISKI
jgi:hypothetical protein